ncbi:MAG: hypothetical protein V3S14_18090 [Anaerolineae bacterium]
MMEKTQELKVAIIATLDILPLESLKLLTEFVTFLRDRMAPDKVSLERQLARDYEALALMYPELAAETSDELWLPLENETLVQVEGVADENSAW